MQIVPSSAYTSFIPVHNPIKIAKLSDKAEGSHIGRDFSESNILYATKNVSVWWVCVSSSPFSLRSESSPLRAAVSPRLTSEEEGEGAGLLTQATPPPLCLNSRFTTAIPLRLESGLIFSAVTTRYTGRLAIIVYPTHRNLCLVKVSHC